MRVPVQQRAARSKPATAANRRAKNKRGISSEGAPPVKIKKRKLQPLIGSAGDLPPPPATPATTTTPPAATATTEVVNNSAPASKRGKLVKKPSARKATEAPAGGGRGGAAGAAVKKDRAKKARAPKLTVGRGKVNATKKVSPTTEKKIGGVKAKKLQSRKLSGADLMVSTGADIGVVKEALISEKAVAENQVIVAKKSQKKPKAVVNRVKEPPRGPKVKEDVTQPACRKRPQKAEKKVAPVKRTPQPGVKSIAATREKKKTRRKATATTVAVAAAAVGGDVGESVGVPVAGTVIAIDATSAPAKTCAFPCSQLEVIDGVARNLIKGGGYTWKKTKESDESCAIKNKIVGSYKSKKQLTKKTPKNVEDIVKREGASENVCFVNPPTMSEEKIDKTLENDIKGKLVAKKALKEKKVETGAKKKVMFKKASPKVAAKTATKVTFQVKQSPPKKRMSKKNKEALMKQQVASGSSFQDDYNSSTSDDCTLDLLLRRQKQLKQEELGVAVKSEMVDVKPIIATALKRETSPVHSPTNQSKHKIKLKVEKTGDSPKPATSILKKVVKKLDNKCKTKLLTIKKQSPAVLKKLMLAARKKVIVTKVKRMRPNEVSRLGTGTDSEQRARRMKLFGFWSGPKRHRVASLNALAKVHCLYENESRGALMSVCTKPPSPEDATGGGGEFFAGDAKPEMPPAIPQDNTTTTIVASTRTLRSGPGRRGIGQHWDQHTSSSSSSDDSAHSDSSSPLKVIKKLIKTKPAKPLKKSKPRRHEVVMDLKDMVVRKRMASLNASAILSASYSPMEKLKKRVGAKDDDSPALPPSHITVVDVDAQHFRKKKGKKKIYLSKKTIDGDEDSDDEGPNVIELATANNKKVATVIVNQDTDVTITGVYVNSTTHRSSTTHEGYCSIAGMQYRISSTSHTQTEATAVATETLLHAAPDLVPAAPSLHPSEPPLQQPIKSYTPLGALSNMQPPGGPLSPLGRRHGCSSAFTAPPPVPPPPPPHHHHHHPPPPPAAGPPDQQQPPYMHGYYQPAGPLISAHHHHGLPKPSVLPPLEASPTSTPPTAAPTAPPPAASASTSSGTRGGDESSDNDVVITATSCNSGGNPGGYPPNPAANQGVPPAYRYHQAYPLPPAPQHMHHQYPYTQYPQQYYPGAVQGVQYAGAPPQQHHYHNPELCYSAPNYPPAPPYYHKTYSTPPPVSYPRRYGPPHPAQYYPPDLYPQPPDQQASRQMVATASTSGYQPPVETYPPPPAPPVVPMVDPYPPPPAPYYPGYPPPAPPCYSHSPPARSLAYIDTAYQCPCPMQSCPKNVHTGPLTGEGKGPDPSAAIFHHLPLPPVALALPSEPPHALGPPSPARGSAGMHPTPSPLATAQGNDSNGTFPSEKREQPYATQISSESRAVMQDLSSKGVGLLTIHKPQGEQPKAKAAARPAGNVGTVYVGNNVQTLTRGSERALDFAHVDAKVESSVKMEVGGDSATKASVAVNGRKRKVKSENVAAPKPKRRNVAAKKVSPKSEQLVQGDAISSVENSVLPSEKTKCKNQPLSSANSCSLHNSKQNAKKRKLSNAEVLAENQEPAAVPTQSQSTQAKEPKSRPKLCPSSKQEVKTKVVKVSKKSIGISEQHKINPAICDFDPVSECSKDVVNLELTKAAPASASKSLARGVPKSAPRMTQKTIMNINSPIQSRKKPATKNQSIEVSPRAASVDTVKTIPVVNGKKPPPKTKLSKSQQQQVAGGVLPPVVGSVKRRRKTDSDASKVSHMLRSHGIQECHWPTENDLNTGNLKASPSFTQSVTTVKSKAPASKKQAAKNGLVKSVELVVYHPPTLKKGSFLKPKWSNGWCWEGEAFQAKVHLNSEEAFVERLCYPAMRHAEGDVIRPLDCVLLKSGARKADLPFVAKVAQLWENADDGEMMVSLLWYYRPEHTDHGRRPDDTRDEIFASKHKDTNSVACIEDKCYVLTFNEYCRYRGNARRLLDGVRDTCAVVPPAPEYPRHGRQPPHCVSPDMVFFCRRVYDFRQKRILKNPG